MNNDITCVRDQNPSRRIVDTMVVSILDYGKVTYTLINVIIRQDH